MKLIRDIKGATAAEFALILPCLVMLTIGTINLCAMLYTYTCLHYAVESAARCGSIGSANWCGTGAANVTAYAQGKYLGISVAPDFFKDATLSTACGGYGVIGTATYKFSTGLINKDIALKAQACRASTT